MNRKFEPPAATVDHYCDVIMGAMASQIASLTSVYSTAYLGADQRKHQSSASLAFVREIHRSPEKFPAQMASNAGNVSIWWRHHVWCCENGGNIYTFKTATKECVGPGTIWNIRNENNNYLHDVSLNNCCIEIILCFYYKTISALRTMRFPLHMKQAVKRLVGEISSILIGN